MKNLKNRDSFKKISIPIIELGGMDWNNFNKVLNSGAKGIEIIWSLMKGQNSKELLNIYNKNTCKSYVFIINSLKER